MFAKAIKIATEAHAGQKDKYGAPYILHLMRVSLRGKNDNEKICGILHDLVEDTDWTFEKLEKEGFSQEIIAALRCVTKGEEE
jgi:(p)ppGpp synthase/HD superfamily hydrolase